MLIKVQYREHIWRCYLATIANYKFLATAWLLV